MDTASPTDDPLRLCISPALFSSHMRHLHEKGYRCFSLSALLAMRKEGTPIPKNSFALTFDDGYQEVFTRAYPILMEYGYTATVFLVTDFIGKCAAWPGATGPLATPLMDWAEVLEMQSHGMDFGSHTRTHRRLPGLPSEEITREAVDSKQILEDRLGVEVSMFSYPYDALDEQSKAIVESSGYQGACGFNSDMYEDCFCAWRIECTGADTLMRFRLKLSTLRRRWLRLKTCSKGARLLRKGKRMVRS